ncbi:amidohydrolase family protein [Candidatus Marimicrobium litorale]|uniref:Amidohydrolase n=1 Tax=Candidatus Marimicrobium litorale TaxID=2518991 RepID=A0ABT3T2N9_9GAMM|nr:amidohydrolase family protein [Candidatus Marimicrobium litorale]MCX2976528.1 amidohydrolase [Candidatus Marimicrobium litorale]
MPMPSEIGIIDLMLAIPGDDNSSFYDWIKPLLLDRESHDMFNMPAQYMFKDIPDTGKHEDYIAYTLGQMDKHGIARAMIGLGFSELQEKALRQHPDRFFASYEANPNRGMEEVRKIVHMHEKFDIKAVTASPAMISPPVPVNDKKWYPIYAKLVELDIPFCPCMGVPGPRVPFGPQKMELLDEVLWFFPELRVVTRHGCEPWTDVAWKMMLKYPNLHYMTSAFAPKYYPPDIIDFANKRGSGQVMYAGYFPMGLSLDRIFREMPDVPLRDEVWPKFLRDNAVRVFKLDQ